MIEFVTYFAAEEVEGIAALGLDPLAILAQGATFVLLFFILKKYALGPIVSTLEDRRKTIEGSLDKAEELAKKNQEAEKNINALLTSARNEAAEIVNNSKKEATTIIKSAEDTAGAKAEKIIADGRAQIASDIERAREELKNETLQLVARATSILIDEKVDAHKNEQLIKKALEEDK